MWTAPVKVMLCRLMEKIEDWFYGAVTKGVNVRAAECLYKQSADLAKQAWNGFGSNADAAKLAGN